MNKQEPKCPCKDCITFMICKTQINKRPSVTLISLDVLIKKCKILKEYLLINNPNKKYEYLDINKYFIVEKIFKINKYKQRKIKWSS